MVSMYSPFEEMTPNEFRHIVEVTFLGAVHGTHCALKQMRPRDRGAIVQVGSALAFRSIPLQSAYCASKHAIEGFTESVRSELIHEKSAVRLTMVNMPALNTTQFTWTKNKMPHKARPTGTIFQPEVAADAILFAMENDRREVMVGYTTVEATLGEKVIPGLLDHYLAHAAWDGSMLPEPADPNQPDNFWQPLPGDHGAHGEFDELSHDFSPQLWATKHRECALDRPAGRRGRRRGLSRDTTDKEGVPPCPLASVNSSCSACTQWGVERIYAYPGDGINGLLAGLRKNDDKPRFIQARHEELAAFMASAHAKFTGTVGVCMATSGPGAIHLLNGLYDAKMDHQPVVAIVGQSATTAIGSQYQQEVDLQSLFKDVASEYCVTVMSPAAVRHCIDRAFRIAIDQHTRDVRHLSQGHSGRSGRARSAAAARLRAIGRRLSRPVHGSPRGRSGRGGGDPQRRAEGRHARRRGRARRARRSRASRRAARRRRGQKLAGQGRRCPKTCPFAPGISAFWEASQAGT